MKIHDVWSVLHRHRACFVVKYPQQLKILQQFFLYLRVTVIAVGWNAALNQWWQFLYILCWCFRWVVAWRLVVVWLTKVRSRRTLLDPDSTSIPIDFSCWKLLIWWTPPGTRCAPSRDLDAPHLPHTVCYSCIYDKYWWIFIGFVFACHVTHQIKGKRHNTYILPQAAAAVLYVTDSGRTAYRP